jgi:hypothetical protein
VTVCCFCLSPRLEAKPKSEVDFTVAHEFAHVALGHQQRGSTAVPPDAVVQSHEDVPSGHDADRLAESWGFCAPQSRAAATEKEMSGSSLDQVSDALRVAAPEV